ncbi:MAG: RHS repeat-associated core domain-containing protein [Chlorobiota bacterium]
MNFVIRDIKNPHTTSGSITNWTYLADVRNISNMYPYGKSYPVAATYSADDDYRYGFNGMEKEKSFDDDGNVADFGARIFDANYPVFLSRDPKESNFPYSSPYNALMNNPISLIDPDGMAVLPTTVFSANNSLNTFFKKVESNSVFRKVMKSFYRDENHVWIHVDQLKDAEEEPTSFLNVARTQSHLSGNNPVAKFNQHRIIINSDILNSAGEIGIDKTFLLMVFIHEADHARKNERLRQDPTYKTYPGYLDFVQQRPKDGKYHNLMGEYNRNILVDAMKEFDAQIIKEGGTVPSYHTDDWY